jgi:hypothetical protein
MERIILDVLGLLGLQHVHPEDMKRLLQLLHADKVKGPKSWMMRAGWALIFPTIFRAVNDRRMMAARMAKGPEVMERF